MQNKNLQFPENIVHQTWLHYFNDYLRKHKIISEEEWRKMQQAIETKTNKKGA